MTTTMPALNGTQPPCSPPLNSTAKRKRADSHSLNTSNTSRNENVSTDDHHLDVRVGESIHNIYQILKRNDTSPSILQHIPTTLTNSNGVDGTEPSAKRTKFSRSESVATKIENQAYRSLEEFSSDVEASSSDLLFEARSKTSGSQWEYAPNTLEQDRLAARITSLQELLRNLVQRETARRKLIFTATEAHASKSPKKETFTNGVKEEGVNDGSQFDTSKSRTVLTLFGNAQGHKQLFSSFQKKVLKVDSKDDHENDNSMVATLSKTVVPVRENGLPNGISSTQILPTPQKAPSTGMKSATILDVFPPPTSTLPLVPPKTPRPLLGRQNSITWTQNNGSTTSKNVIGYAHQKLTAGHWLGYDGVSPLLDAVSPETKRKQRDRTLSTGESGSTPSEVAVAAQTQAREDALFRSAYSSFAPCRDNSAAIVPDETRNQLWWQKIGSRHMSQVLPEDSIFVPEPELLLDGTDDEEAAFKDAVDSFEPEVMPLKDSAATAANEGEELLKEVSEMLETLHSYQRIRNSCLNTNARSSVGQNPPLQDLMGSPSVPSTAEIETYNALKAQLVLIISLLPPYAVARLDGEQLEELQISQRMPIETPTYRGVLEDDQASRAAKAAAFNAAIGATSMSSRQTAAMTPSALQYSSGQARTAQMTAPARSNTQQYYGGAPPSLSRQSSSFTRQPLSAWQTPAPNYNTPTGQRPSYNNQHSFGQQQQQQQSQTSRPLTNSIRPSLPQYPQSRSSSSTTQHQVNGGTYQPTNTTTPSQPAYQQRAQNYAANTNYNFKPSYNAASYNAAHNTAQTPQYPRSSYLVAQPTQSVSPAPPTPSANVSQGVSYSNNALPQMGSAPVGQMNMGVQKQQQQPQVQVQPQPQPQAQSPGLNATTALMTGRSASGTPQP